MPYHPFMSNSPMREQNLITTFRKDANLHYSESLGFSEQSPKCPNQLPSPARCRALGKRPGDSVHEQELLPEGTSQLPRHDSEPVPWNS